MISVSIENELKRLLSNQIISILFFKDGVYFNKFYTTNTNSFKKTTKVPSPKLDRSIIVYNLIMESYEEIELDNIKSFGYDSSPTNTQYADMLNSSKESLNELLNVIPQNSKKRVLNVITNYVDKICNDSITIHDVLTSLKTNEILNICLNINNILDFLYKTIGIELKHKILLLFLGVYTENELFDVSKLDEYKKRYMELINYRIEKEKITIKEEFDKLKKDYPELSEDEINCMKDYLDTLKDDYSIFNNKKEDLLHLFFTSWPSILAPNPFELLIPYL